MKSKEDLFNEKMPSSLKSRILADADEQLEQNFKAHRQSLFSWILGAGVAAAAAGISFVFVRQNASVDNQQMEFAQSVDVLEEIQNDDDLELLADFDVIEDLDLVIPMEDES